MTDIKKTVEHSSRYPATKRLLLALVPILFLAVGYWTLRRGSFGTGRESKPNISEAESHRLADLSKSTTDHGDYAGALPPTLKLHSAYPDNQIYVGRLANIYDHLGQYDEETKYWERYMDHAPSPIGACPEYGQAYWKQGEKFEAQAIAAYQRCLSLDPTNTDSVFYLAHALEMSNQWMQAADQYQRGLTISPSYDDLTLGLARCWLRMGKADEAKKLVLPLLNKPSVSSGAMLVMGMYYLHQENYAKAKKVLTSGARLADSDPDFPVLLARVAEQMNDNGEALRQYARVVELKPDDERARSRKNVLLAAQGAGK
jgi:tetratricopeptide (TPR) repeat protein